MKKILLSALLLSAAACSKGGSGSCNSNATLIEKTASVEKITKQSEGVYQSPKGSTVSEMESTVLKLNSGKELDLSSSESSEYEEATATLDLNNLVLTLEDRVLNLVKLAKNVFTVKEDEMKSMYAEQIKAEEKGTDMQTCSIEKVSNRMILNEQHDQVTVEWELVRKVQVAQSFLNQLKGEYDDSSEVGSDEYYELGEER